MAGRKKEEDLQGVTEQNDVVEQEVNEVKPEKKKVVTEMDLLNNNELITIRNNTYGKLIVPVQSYGKDYNITLETYGDLDTISARDFVFIRNSHKKMITNGWLAVDNKEHFNAFRLDRLVKGVIGKEEIDDFFDMNIEQMNKYIDELSTKNKIILIDALKDRIVNDEFDSSTVVKFLENKLGFENNELDKQKLLQERQ